MKAAEFGCSFEREMFHKSPTKVCPIHPVGLFFAGLLFLSCTDPHPRKLMTKK